MIRDWRDVELETNSVWYERSRGAVNDECLAHELRRRVDQVNGWLAEAKRRGISVGIEAHDQRTMSSLNLCIDEHYDLTVLSVTKSVAL